MIRQASSSLFVTNSNNVGTPRQITLSSIVWYFKLLVKMNFSLSVRLWKSARSRFNSISSGRQKFCICLESRSLKIGYFSLSNRWTPKSLPRNSGWLSGSTFFKLNTVFILSNSLLRNPFLFQFRRPRQGC